MCKGVVVRPGGERIRTFIKDIEFTNRGRDRGSLVAPRLCFLRLLRAPSSTLNPHQTTLNHLTGYKRGTNRPVRCM